MNNKKFRFFVKYIIIPIVAIVVIIGGLMSSLSILKEESIQNYTKISTLYAKTFLNDLNQDISHIESMIDNINTIIRLKDPLLIQEKTLDALIKNYPQIRSINILNNKNEIIISSNIKNITYKLFTKNFYPKPFFNNNIIRISNVFIGRDFYNLKNNKSITNIDNEESRFFSILKETKIENKNFKVIVNINSDFFINKYLINLDLSSAEVNLLRAEGTLLLSTNKDEEPGENKEHDKEFFTKISETNSFSSIEDHNNLKYIETYKLSNEFPFIIQVKLDLENSLSSWEEKKYDFFIIATSLVLISVLIGLFLFFLYSKEKEKEMRLQELQIKEHKKFKVLFENTNLLTMFINQNGLISEINSTFLNILNIKFNELKNIKLWELELFKNKDADFIKELLTSNENNLSIEREFSLQNKQNQEIIINLIFSTINLDGQRNIVAIGFDVTKKKEKERLLKQALTVFQNTRDGIMITDKEVNLIRVNKAFEKITGYKESEVLGKTPRILKSDFHNDEFYECIWNDLKNYDFWEGEIVNKNKDSEIFTEWLTINAVYDEKSNLINYIGVFSDITMQKKNEEMIKENEDILLKQSKMASMGEMIENIAHQWRQPLSVISTVATGIKFKKEYGIVNNNEIEELTAINESAQYLSNTIEDFKSFLQNNKKASSFNTDYVINKSISLISSKLKNSSINIIRDIEDIDIFSFENELIQVLLNIMNNAQDALEDRQIKNKYIFISVKKEQDIVLIEIKDNAGGISTNIIHRVFEPYFTTKHKSRGTGIGLYMSAQIIKNYIKGTLSCKNTHFIYENISYTGALFKISIPLKRN